MITSLIFYSFQGQGRQQQQQKLLRSSLMASIGKLVCRCQDLCLWIAMAERHMM